MGYLLDYLRQFGKPGITIAYILGTASVAYFFLMSSFAHSLFSFEERMLYLGIGVVVGTYYFVKALLIVKPIQHELFAQYPITTLSIIKNNAAHIEAIFIGTEKDMRRAPSWRALHPQFYALKLSRVYYDPSVPPRDRGSVYDNKILGVKYKNGLYQFALLRTLEVYDAVQFLKPYAQSGMGIDGAWESLKNTQPQLTAESPRRIFIGVLVGVFIIAIFMALSVFVGIMLLR